MLHLTRPADALEEVSRQETQRQLSWRGNEDAAESKGRGVAQAAIAWICWGVLRPGAGFNGL